MASNVAPRSAGNVRAGRTERICKQHRNRHRAHAAGYRGDRDGPLRGCGEVDIADASRPIKKAETEACRSHDPPIEPFEIQVARPDYLQPPVATQVISLPGGGTEQRQIPVEMLDGWGGLDNFMTLEIESAATDEVRTFRLTWCPGGERQRVNDDGPALPTYPEGCFANPFTRGVIWGIDAGWAVNPFGYRERPFRLAPGRYSITASIADRYVDLFGVDPAQSSVTMNAIVEQYECGRHGCHLGRDSAKVPGPGPSPRVPTMDNPDPALLPDLQSLPAWGINVQNRRRGEFMSFGANVWTGGAASLVVEGFRRSGEDVMDAYQYFFDAKGKEVGSVAAGTMEWDARTGHRHWHFTDFAQYNLLKADKKRAVKSGKEAFCLAPTDAIDILLPGAERAPYEIGLGTACGGPAAIWIREILPLGWGDTYFQGLPGQSFWITNLPNGTYFIKVEANPGGKLHETTATNNVELREIHIRGRSGQRRIEVPLWNGIDTEGGFGRG